MRWSGGAVLLAALLLFQATTPAAWAQSSQMQQLLNRMERMQLELTTLQRQVYKRGATARGVAAPAPSGPQARKLTARMSVRITQLEDELRRLTGKTEEFIHAVQQMRTRIEKLASDVELRLSALERGGVATGAPPPAPGGAAAGSAAVPAADGAGLGPSHASGPRTLGTIRQSALPGSGAPAATPAAPAMTPKQQYDYAHSLIVKDQNFAEAEKVLRAFIEAHPRNELAPNAHYWLGRTYFVRKDYQTAAFTFAEGFQKFPKSSKAADNLMNLGMSLAQLEKKKEACTAFARLLKNYSNLGGNAKRRVTREQKRLRCR